jgi:hypothetical protein
MAFFGPWPAAGDETPSLADKRCSGRLSVFGAAALRLPVGCALLDTDVCKDQT